MVIVDASVLIAYLDDRVDHKTAWLKKHGRLQRIGITSLTQTEVLQGIRSDQKFFEALNTFYQFEIFEIGSSALAVASAMNYRTLRKSGLTVRSTIDCLIATFCIQEGHMLLHNDRDFDVFEGQLGLRVLHP